MMKHVKKFRTFIVLLILGLFLTFFIKQKYIEYCGVSPESMKEINIARNLAEGKGFTLSIKDSYITHHPVIHPAAGEKGLLYPLILSVFINKTYKLQWINLILSFLTALMLFYLAKDVFNEKIAWFSYITFLFLPQAGSAASYLWDNTLLLFLLVVAALVFVKMKSFWGDILTGVLLGLTYWTNPWAFLFIPALLPGLLLSRGDFKKSLKTTGLVTLSFFLVSLPLFIWTFIIYKTPISPNIPVYFQVKNFSDYLWQSYNYPLPGIPGFVKSNSQWILSSFGRNIKIQLSFFTAKQILPAFIIAIAGFIFAGKKAYKEFPRRFLPMLSFSVLYFLGACLVWSYIDFIKTPVFSLIFLIPVIFYFLCRIEIRSFPLGLMLAVIVLVLSLNRFIAIHYHVYPAELRRYEFKTQLSYGDVQIDWINDETKKTDRIAAVYPWVMNLKTHRPCGLMPTNLNLDQTHEFVKKFGYNYIVENERAKKGDYLRTLLGDVKIPWLQIILNGLWQVQKN